jgi:hypothetical protein
MASDEPYRIREPICFFDPIFEQGGHDMPAYHVPCGVKVFRTIKGAFSSCALSPPRDAFSLDLHEECLFVIDPAEAGFEEMNEREADLPENDSVNSHVLTST